MNADQWMNRLINEYHDFLKERTIVMKDAQTGWHTISTPYMGLFNDTISLYCQKQEKKIVLSDDGETLLHLEELGVSMQSHKRKELLMRTLLNYGVQREGDELLIYATEENFAQCKHNMLTAIAEISEMHILAKSNISTIFSEDVQAFLDEKEIIYTPKFIAKGSTGLDFVFDFQVARKGSELVIKSFNNLDKLHLSEFLFGWEDIRQTRSRVSGKPLHGLAIVNDQDKTAKPEFLEAILSKGADYILWSERSNTESMHKLSA